MAISVDYINNLLRDFDASGQKKHGSQWRRSNTGFSESTKRVALKNLPIGLDEERPFAAGSYYSFAQTLITVIYNYIHQYIKSFPANALHFGELQIERTELKGNRTRTDRTISIYVDEDALWRDSLWNSSSDSNMHADSPRQRLRMSSAEHYWSPSRNKYGVDNILYLFEYGWHARGRVKGVWHGRDTWNRQQFSGTFMLHNAIEFFNKTTPRGITAKLDKRYQ